jgi:lipoprotein-anchoring transpeptidase ErfK/SrfK
VAAVQARLHDLGYWLTDATGTYGESTAHAVVAFQKAAGLERDGVVGPLTRGALSTAVRLVPRSTSGHAIEIDLDRQLLLDVGDGRVKWVFDTSTGRVAGTTPLGHFRVTWQIDGWVHSRLGILYRPKYFSGGVAIHGNPSVPPSPASHGCVRVINAAMDWLWANDEIPIGTSVWVY